MMCIDHMYPLDSYSYTRFLTLILLLVGEIIKINSSCTIFSDGILIFWNTQNHLKSGNFGIWHQTRYSANRLEDSICPGQNLSYITGFILYPVNFTYMRQVPCLYQRKPILYPDLSYIRLSYKRFILYQIPSYIFPFLLTLPCRRRASCCCRC